MGVPGSKILLNDLSPRALGEALARRCGANARELPKLLAAIHGPRGVLAGGAGIEALAGVPQVRRVVLDAILAEGEIRRLTSAGHVTSPQDGFRRHLFEVEGAARGGLETASTEASRRGAPSPWPSLPRGERGLAGERGLSVEAVRIPLPCDVHGTVPPARLVTRPHYVVCVSSQVGCALGCSFCATGKLGFTRNLATWEIVEQLRLVRAAAALDPEPRPVRGVVFMGMGEPFLNYDRVIAAAEIFSHPAGFAISADRITISTAGVVPGLRRFTAERQPYRLAVSLTAATSEKRRQVMPIESTWPLPELMAAVRDHQAVAGGRSMLAWVAIDGFNTAEADARELAELTAGLPIRLDLIEVADPDGPHRPPSEQGLADFRTHLRVLGQPVVRRYSGGRDIRAGCGMLAASAIDAALVPPHPAPIGG